MFRLINECLFIKATSSFRL